MLEGGGGGICEITCPCIIQRFFQLEKKNENFSEIFLIILIILPKTLIVCTRKNRIGSKMEMVYPSKPQFYFIKVGFKGVFITWACFPDGSIDSFMSGPYCTSRGRKFKTYMGATHQDNMTVHTLNTRLKKVQVGNDEEKAQSERESLSKNRGGKKLN